MPEQLQSTSSPPLLKRELNVWDAVWLGLGSMLGTGVFVSIGIAAGLAGPAVILAVAIAAVVATCNGLSSAQLAANHPVSGGTYEYGYRYLTPWLGFIAGWTFLLAKSASAATAALGFAGYVLSTIAPDRPTLLIPTALMLVLVLTVLVLGGVRRSSMANTLMVAITLLALVFFVVAGLPQVIASEGRNLIPVGDVTEGQYSVGAFLQATALIFVAYTGYGRIATLGEEVRHPRRTIPKAILIAMLITMLLYISVAIVSVGAVGAPLLGSAAEVQAAPLEMAARSFGIPGSASVLAVGAVTAMVGVVLNLILGLSRVLLAMARRHDVPFSLARLNVAKTTPAAAVWLVGGAIAVLVLVGNVKTTWSFSAFTVLIYYAITNVAALKLSAQERLYPRWTAWLGLAACLFLAFWVEWEIWLMGLVLIAIGAVWHGMMQWSRNQSN
ncbi:amino acid permease [Oculatella sp. LEGE 06141]|uniref:APC family permease n=1 Tax=Oculatella sp. LEGE 06141 TaxID=1828648 RepID=UPI001881029B|nr:APC family permease [Oculatella sp. LEGE 06141]MBE9180973.1 amino acid permease [Oculatella sp. LEGE 06141]